MARMYFMSEEFILKIEKEYTELVPGDQMFSTISGRYGPKYFLNIMILKLLL